MTSTGVDSIVECNLAEDFDFGDRAQLTARIEARTVEFIRDVEGFLSDRG